MLRLASSQATRTPSWDAKEAITWRTSPSLASRSRSKSAAEFDGVLHLTRK